MQQQNSTMPLPFGNGKADSEKGKNAVLPSKALSDGEKICYTERQIVIFVWGLELEKKMLDHEQRIVTLEKDTTTMKRDIIYKLDDTNSAVTIIRGIVGNQGQDIREIRNQVKIVNVHLDGIDTRLDGLKEEIRAIKDQQDTQGQDIKEIKRHLDAIDGKFEALDGKFEQVLQLLTTLKDKAE